MQTLLMLSTFVAASSLFSQLDANSDGRIEKSELSARQAPFFERAIRVGDLDFDGALTVRELAIALQEPKRMTPDNSRQRYRRANLNFDPKSLDKNKDGYVSLEEVPAAARSRFQQLLKRIGQSQIPVDLLTRMRESQSNNGKQQKP